MHGREMQAYMTTLALSSLMRRASSRRSGSSSAAAAIDIHSLNSYNIDAATPLCETCALPSVCPLEPMAKATVAKRRMDGLRVIALLKLGKALLLLATTYGIYRLLDPGAVARLFSWLGTLTDSFERRLLIRALAWFSEIEGTKIKAVVAVTSMYTLLLTTEGVGLWLRKRWAEWLTVIATSSLIPFELWELSQRPPGHEWLVVCALIVNVAIVIYLIVVLRSRRQ